MKTIDKSKPVLVTGATGYVAGWIVKKLLDAGLAVHAAVRDPENKQKLRYLDALAEKAPGTITYYEADLMDEGAYDEAMQDCELVFHTASPFTLNVEDPKNDLIEPAQFGTRNVLESASRTQSVKRVVLTSSCAAIYGDAIDFQNYPDGMGTEETWNTTSSLDSQPYSYSKTLAEQEAWSIADAQDHWDLVVINPSLVLGPGINPKGTSESFNVVKQLADGTMKLGAPPMEMGMVDVRDVAEAHIRAGFTPGAHGRHIVSSESKSLLELGKILSRNIGGDYPFPKNELPKFMVWLLGPLSGIPRSMVSKNMGYPWRVDNTKSKKELGLEYTPVEVSITEFFKQMEESGILASKN